MAPPPTDLAALTPGRGRGQVAIGPSRRTGSPGLALLLALCGGLAPGAWAAPFGVAELMDTLASAPQGRASFVELKYISILDLPVESSGELEFRPPDRLVKRTLRPVPETLALEGDTLVMERKGQRLALGLAEAPAAASLIESLRATLAGDRGSLERVYRLGLVGSAQGWTLRLAPRDARVGALVSEIVIEGVGAQVRQVEIIQPDGDRSVMRVDPAPRP